jgi:hypothetical protein
MSGNESQTDEQKSNKMDFWTIIFIGAISSLTIIVILMQIQWNVLEKKCKESQWSYVKTFSWYECIKNTK